MTAQQVGNKAQALLSGRTRSATPAAVPPTPAANPPPASAHPLPQPAASVVRTPSPAPGRAPAAASRAKRIFDVLVSATLLLLLTPVLLVVALLIRTTSRGPVIYRQQRIGLGGAEFTVLKFRSMRVGADRQLTALARMNEAPGPLFKIRHDPRVTPVGRWIRRLSVDELPQLVNVLTGSMSLVGPRPALPQEVATFATVEHRRHLVRPGITGAWQVHGRSDLDWVDGIALDLDYVDHWSFGTDVRILVRTVPAVLGARGAY